MKTYTVEEMKKVLAEHKKWIDGEGGSQANLRSANLYGADLYGANLRSANLYGADLRSANLYGANLRSADLYGANLYGADLRSADLYGANLYGADLKDAQIHPGCTLPEEGNFIAFKKVAGGVVLKLEIIGPRVSSYIGRKCRCHSARVIAAVSGIVTSDVFRSLHDSNFTYKIGEVVTVENWNSDPTVECEAGIHFYMTKAEAEAH